MALDSKDMDAGKGVWKSGKGKGRRHTKGRQLDDAAWSEVQSLLEGKSLGRDLLIEHLHLIQDKFGCLSAAHLRALAEEMRLSMAEVYEVATFYAHFDVVKEGETPPPALTIRVCDSLSCELAGAQAAVDAARTQQSQSADAAASAAEAAATAEAERWRSERSSLESALAEARLRAEQLQPAWQRLEAAGYYQKGLETGAYPGAFPGAYPGVAAEPVGVGESSVPVA